VKLIGGYCGLSDSKDGPTHQSVIDLAVMRAMPNIRVVCASDAPTARQALRAIVADEGPWYLRISRAETPTLWLPDAPFELGKARMARDLGADCAILATGTPLANALEAQTALLAQGIRGRVAEVHTLKPLDDGFVVRMAQESGVVVTVEEHSVIGGLGGAVAEALSSRCPVPAIRVGLNDTFAESGEIRDLEQKYGLDPAAIARAVEQAVRMKGRARPTTL
jgi:transketolase